MCTKSAVSCHIQGVGLWNEKWYEGLRADEFQTFVLSNNQCMPHGFQVLGGKQGERQRKPQCMDCNAQMQQETKLKF